MKVLGKLSLLSLVVLWAGCSGGPRTVSPLPGGDQSQSAIGASSAVQQAPEDAGTSGGTLSFKITVPKLQPKGQNPSYVSPASKGLELSWTGPVSGHRAFVLSGKAAHCKQATRSCVCTISVVLRAGNFSGTIDVYDKPPAGGADSA